MQLKREFQVVLKISSISENISNHKCWFMKAHRASSLSAVLQSPEQSGEGKLFDPLHFPDLPEHDALRISSLRLAAIGEHLVNSSLLGNRDL